LPEGPGQDQAPITRRSFVLEGETWIAVGSKQFAIDLIIVDDDVKRSSISIPEVTDSHQIEFGRSPNKPVSNLPTRSAEGQGRPEGIARKVLSVWFIRALVDLACALTHRASPKQEVERLRPSAPEDGQWR
jgi:hypothetical protein